MNIAGLQKMTLLDFPGKIACTVFLQGCNFCCPFCHNSDLLPGQGEVLMDHVELLGFLKKRQGLLDGVCVSGGEPTLQPELENLLREIKNLGFAVKLDTNGSKPETLKKLVEAGLVDYVAMDIKNSPERYGDTTGCPGISLEKIRQSAAYLISGTVDYEFRTTVVAQFHDDVSMEQMGAWLASLVPGQKPKRLYLQSYVDRDSVLVPGLSAPTEEQMSAWANILTPYIVSAEVRGAQ